MTRSRLQVYSHCWVLKLLASCVRRLLGFFCVEFLHCFVWISPHGLVVENRKRTFPKDVQLCVVKEILHLLINQHKQTSEYSTVLLNYDETVSKKKM